jgi:hypothetical protein
MGADQQTSTVHAALLAVSGGLAGGLAKTTVAPLERVKLLLQTGECTAVTTSFAEVVRHEGILALWRGNTVNVVRMVPSKAVLLSCSDLYKEVLGVTHLSSFVQGGAAGALAGATASLCTYPLDLARTRMAGMVHEAGSTAAEFGALATLTAIHRREGFAALFRGASPTVLGALPYEGLKFGTYGWLKSASADTAGSGGASSLWRACCGATAAMVAHLLTYPNDVLRRRLQMDGADGARPRYRGYLDCALQIVRSEGWGGLYRGLGVCMVRAVPNTGVQFMVYEGCKDMLGRR